MEIAKPYLSRVGQAGEYSHVTGQLSYVHAGGGIWVVRYAPLDREDRYGGSFVLAPLVDMEKYQDGDLVTVHGEVLHEGRASRHLGGSLYKVTSISLIDRLVGVSK